MAEQNQTIVEPGPNESRPKGDRNDANLRAAFPSSPIYKPPSEDGITDAERKETFKTLVLDGVVVQGYGVNEFNRDYTGTTANPVPNLEEVETGGGGLPASPYIPNLTSPGPGSLNAADQPVYSGELPKAENQNEFGAGLGGLVSPSESSSKMSENSLGNFISGRSYEGSAGS